MEERVNIGRAEQFLASAKSVAEAVDRSTHSLPRVNEDGSSDCGFAEELYARHEELHSKLQGLLGQAHEYLTAVEEEITKLAHDLTVLSTQQDRLHRDAPRSHFSEAEAAVAALYNRYQQLRDQIVETIQYLDQVLQEASTKRFPGRIPRQWPSLGGTTSGPQSPEGVDTRDTVDRELDELFEMDRHGCDQS